MTLAFPAERVFGPLQSVWLASWYQTKAVTLEIER